ncbi:MAG: hypothetical protein ACYCY8_10710 [Burkholderiales bacterium]
MTVGFFGLLAYLATHDVPGTSEKILDVMIGSLGTPAISRCKYTQSVRHESIACLSTDPGQCFGRTSVPLTVGLALIDLVFWDPLITGLIATFFLEIGI